MATTLRRLSVILRTRKKKTCYAARSVCYSQCLLSRSRQEEERHWEWGCKDTTVSTSWKRCAWFWGHNCKYMKINYLWYWSTNQRVCLHLMFFRFSSLLLEFLKKVPLNGKEGNESIKNVILNSLLLSQSVFINRSYLKIIISFPKTNRKEQYQLLPNCNDTTVFSL